MAISAGALERPWSTVRLLVTMSAICSSFGTFAKVPSDLIFRVIEARKACCDWIRSKSLPSPKACRVRRKASAWSPEMLEVPAGRFSPEA